MDGSDRELLASSACLRVLKMNSKKMHEQHEVQRCLTIYLLLSKMKRGILPVGNQENATMKQTIDVQQGTLDLMVLKTLDVLGPLYVYGVARRIEQISGNLLAVSQGALYPVLLKLEQEGAITSEWGAPENNRQARFYRRTRPDISFSRPRLGTGRERPRSSVGF